MLHPMLQLGSLAEDLRQGCSWLARERLAPCKRMKDAARPYDGAQAWRRLRLEQQMLYDVCNAHYVVYQERILLVVMNTLITPTIYLANSILEIVRGDVSSTTLAAAFIGLHYFAYFGAFSFIGQRFFFESARSKEILHGFLVQADPRQIEENNEVSKFITQIERQTKYRVWGLFQIDTNFTLGVLLAATTHVALLCQVGASFYT
ncbi:uncharacterized protein LOC113212222 isoform X1 [Frankliniella occidentalis]|uniref:Uncharacterized protein LOC113212222 isoform X1 n=1 Tax=Frankliniella occidentalis TaxID=133901 RepID=A0A6J1T4S6_FRAOC|nr:uncharacterized protein LOC113212222 isoform X1 [Frankliniella occidentalis]